MKWPLAPVAVCLALGIVAGDVWGGDFIWLLLAASAAATLALRAPRPWQGCWLGLGLFLAGWANLNWHAGIQSPLDLRWQLAGTPVTRQVRGHLVEAPMERRKETPRGTRLQFSAVIEVNALREDGAWTPAAGRVFVQTPEAPPQELAEGRECTVTGVLAHPPGAAAPGLFDFRAHLRRQGIHFQMQTTGLRDWELGPADRGPADWGRRFQTWARAVLQGSFPPDDPMVELLQAMTLGWKAGLTREIAEPFMLSGTMHLFAISGLHVALIALVLVELMRAVGVPRRICGGLLIPLLWFYTAATGWQASAVRAALMATVVAAGWVGERPGNLLNSLAGAAAVILVADPQQLFQAGFQLSFLVVLSIGLIVPPLEAWRQKWFHPDPLLPPELRPRWQRWLDAPVRGVLLNLGTSLAAWLGSLPLIAACFHLVTPGALLANLVIVPLSSLALMGCLGALLTAGWPGMSDLFAHSAWLAMLGMVRLSAWFAALPGGWWPVPAPGPAILVAYYTLLAAACAQGWRSPWRPRLAAATATVLLGLTLAAVHEHRHRVQLTLLDVRGGDAHVFLGGQEHPDLLIDAGGDSAPAFILKPYLWSCGRRTLPDLLVTHGDVHHVGGAAQVVEDFAISRLCLSPVPSRSPGYRQLLAQWQKRGRDLQWIQQGDGLGPWRVLHPDAGDRFAAGDDNSVVLHGTFHGVQVLLLSDLGRYGQRVLQERHPNLRADIVVTGLPARDEPLGEELLARLAPQWVLVTCATQPAAEQASLALRQRLGRGPWRTCFLSDTGTVTLRFAATHCEIATQHGTSGRVVPRPRSQPPG